MVPREDELLILFYVLAKQDLGHVGFRQTISLLGKQVLLKLSLLISNDFFLWLCKAFDDACSRLVVLIFRFLFCLLVKRDLTYSRLIQHRDSLAYI